MKNKIYQLSLFGLVCMAFGLLLGWLIDIRHLGEDDDPTVFSETRESGFTLINPLLECDSAKASIRKKTLKPFETSVTNFVEQTRKELKIESISVYFRELNDGLWFSVGDVENYRPVSLLKMPLLIAAFKQQERSPGFLQYKVRYDGRNDLNAMQAIKPAKTLSRGASYTVEELVSRMILYSDNNAFNELEGIIDPRIYHRVYSDLGIKMSTLDNPDQMISAKQFATFLRILYNASYLNRELSEKALDLLTRGDFKAGIVAGVPDNIAVAHKFGEGGQDGVAELHDCGIVYFPRHPYILCVLSRGKSYENLNEAIQLISSSIYSNVEEQHKADHLR
ncbi:MAG: class A beta-lactamase-related serine hydrolase [Nitrospirota bacterium]|nr:class A beta-lactamase-related serine hydrolase [Nitrospirota bacterium]